MEHGNISPFSCGQNLNLKPTGSRSFQDRWAFNPSRVSEGLHGVPSSRRFLKHACLVLNQAAVHELRVLMFPGKRSVQTVKVFREEAKSSLLLSPQRAAVNERRSAGEPCCTSIREKGNLEVNQWIMSSKGAILALQPAGWLCSRRGDGSRRGP